MDDQIQTVTAPMPRYRCHKEVHALKIAEIHHPDFATALSPGPSTLLCFEDGRFAAFPVSPEWVAKHGPKPGGYLVIYDDGYQSFSPAAAFESGYALIEDGD